MWKKITMECWGTKEIMSNEIIVSMLVAFVIGRVAWKSIEYLEKHRNQKMKRAMAFCATCIYIMYTYLGLLVYVMVSIQNIGDFGKMICLFLCIAIPNYFFKKIIPDADVELEVYDKRVTFLMGSIAVIISGFVVKEFVAIRENIIIIIITVLIGFFVPFEIWIGEYGVRGKVASEKEILYVIWKQFKDVKRDTVICNLITIAVIGAGIYRSKTVNFEKIVWGFSLGTIIYVIFFVAYKRKHKNAKK